jgi:hypothetical protein
MSMPKQSIEHAFRVHQLGSRHETTILPDHLILDFSRPSLTYHRISIDLIVKLLLLTNKTILQLSRSVLAEFEFDLS